GWSEQAPQTTGAVRDRWESLQAIVTLADDLCRPAAGEREPVDEREPADEREPGTEGEADLGTLVAELERRATIQYAPTGAGVTLSTLHAAKGLEWGMVAMVGLSEGLLPISYADTPQAVEEERRLFYVGVTRAKSQLLLSFAAARAAGGRSVRSRSRFLTGIGEPVRRRARGPAAAKSGKGTLHRRCRSCGADLNTAAARKTGRCRDCPPPYDAALFEELRSWRKRTAEEAGMPAFVVFTDSTLELIAEHRPGDVAGLSRISGVGPAKLNRYGDGILTVIRQWEAAHC
ncbi:MAG: ATP-dependent DNA helicase, partial [Micrococcales bacterium]